MFSLLFLLLFIGCAEREPEETEPRETVQPEYDIEMFREEYEKREDKRDGHRLSWTQRLSGGDGESSVIVRLFGMSWAKSRSKTPTKSPTNFFPLAAHSLRPRFAPSFARPEGSRNAWLRSGLTAR